MALSNAEQVARDIADVLAHTERPQAEWGEVAPVGPRVVAGLIAGHEVLPHVQRFADAVRAATKVKSIGTYPGHSPSLERALDLFHAIGDHALADAICEFGIANQERFGVRYIISRQRIWHRLDPVWRWMEDRGDATQNHLDHGHFSFETKAAEPEPEPEPTPEPEPVPEEVLPMEFSYIVGDEDWVWWGAERIHTRCAEGTVLDGVTHKRLGRKPKAFHEWLFAVAENAGFSR